MTYDTLNEEILDKLDEVEYIISDPTLAPLHRRQLEGEMADIARELGRYEGANALVGHLSEFLMVAGLGYVPGNTASRSELEPATELTTLCECDRADCPVKRGDLPPELQEHGSGRYRTGQSVSQQLADYLREHTRAVALHEAKHVWDEWVGDIRRRIRRLSAAAETAVQHASETPHDDSADPLPALPVPGDVDVDSDEAGDSEAQTDEAVA